MNLQQRIELMTELGNYLKQNNEDWQAAKQKAYEHNGWFTPEFTDYACQQITENFLDKNKSIMSCFSSKIKIKIDFELTIIN